MFPPQTIAAVWVWAVTHLAPVRALASVQKTIWALPTTTTAAAAEGQNVYRPHFKRPDKDGLCPFLSHSEDALETHLIPDAQLQLFRLRSYKVKESPTLLSSLRSGQRKIHWSTRCPHKPGVIGQDFFFIFPPSVVNLDIIKIRWR